MNLYQNGNLSVNGKITSPTITSINSSLDSKAPISHDHTSSDINDIQTYVDNRMTLMFNHMFDFIHFISSVMIFQNALSVLGATPTFNNNHLYYSWNETTWEYLPDAVFLRNGSINSNTHEETGATFTPSGSDTYNHTTANHTLTNDEIITLSIVQKQITNKEIIKKFYYLILTVHMVNGYIKLFIT